MRVLLTGANGLLGSYLLRQLQEMDVVPWNGEADVDLARPDEVKDAFQKSKATIVLHAGAMASIAACQQNPERAHIVNVEATLLLAMLAAEGGARMVFASSDLVFDGQRGRYREEDEPHPLSIYGATKLAAEAGVLAQGGLVVRLSLLFGPSLTQRLAFFDHQVQALREGRPIDCFEDEWRTPLSLKAAAQALVELSLADIQGVIHVGGPERLTRMEMGTKLAGHLKVDPALVRAVTRNADPSQEPRPCDTALDCARWRRKFPESPWPTFENALGEML